MNDMNLLRQTEMTLSQLSSQDKIWDKEVAGDGSIQELTGAKRGWVSFTRWIYNRVGDYDSQQLKKFQATVISRLEGRIAGDQLTFLRDRINRVNSLSGVTWQFRAEKTAQVFHGFQKKLDVENRTQQSEEDMRQIVARLDKLEAQDELGIQIKVRNATRRLPAEEEVNSIKLVFGQDYSQTLLQRVDSVRKNAQTVLAMTANLGRLSTVKDKAKNLREEIPKLDPGVRGTYQQHILAMSEQIEALESALNEVDDQDDAVRMHKQEVANIIRELKSDMILIPIKRYTDSINYKAGLESLLSKGSGIHASMNQLIGNIEFLRGNLPYQSYHDNNLALLQSDIQSFNELFVYGQPIGQMIRRLRDNTASFDDFIQSVHEAMELYDKLPMGAMYSDELSFALKEAVNDLPRRYRQLAEDIGDVNENISLPQILTRLQGLRADVAKIKAVMNKAGAIPEIGTTSQAKTELMTIAKNCRDSLREAVEKRRLSVREQVNSLSDQLKACQSIEDYEELTKTQFLIATDLETFHEVAVELTRQLGAFFNEKGHAVQVGKVFEEQVNYIAKALSNLREPMDHLGFVISVEDKLSRDVPPAELFAMILSAQERVSNIASIHDYEHLTTRLITALNTVGKNLSDRISRLTSQCTETSSLEQLTKAFGEVVQLRQQLSEPTGIFQDEMNKGLLQSAMLTYEVFMKEFEKRINLPETAIQNLSDAVYGDSLPTPSNFTKSWSEIDADLRVWEAAISRMPDQDRSRQFQARLKEFQNRLDGLQADYDFRMGVYVLENSTPAELGANLKEARGFLNRGLFSLKGETSITSLRLAKLVENTELRILEDLWKKYEEIRADYYQLDINTVSLKDNLQKVDICLRNLNHLENQYHGYESVFKSQERQLNAQVRASQNFKGILVEDRTATQAKLDKLSGNDQLKERADLFHEAGDLANAMMNLNPLDEDYESGFTECSLRVEQFEKRVVALQDSLADIDPHVKTLIETSLKGLFETVAKQKVALYEEPFNKPLLQLEKRIESDEQLLEQAGEIRRQLDLFDKHYEFTMHRKGDVLAWEPKTTGLREQLNKAVLFRTQLHQLTRQEGSLLDKIDRLAEAEIFLHRLGESAPQHILLTLANACSRAQEALKGSSIELFSRFLKRGETFAVDRFQMIRELHDKILANEENLRKPIFESLMVSATAALRTGKRDIEKGIQKAQGEVAAFTPDKIAQCKTPQECEVLVKRLGKFKEKLEMITQCAGLVDVAPALAIAENLKESFDQVRQLVESAEQLLLAVQSVRIVQQRLEGANTRGAIFSALRASRAQHRKLSDSGAIVALQLADSITNAEDRAIVALQLADSITNAEDRLISQLQRSLKQVGEGIKEKNSAQFRQDIKVLKELQQMLKNLSQQQESIIEVGQLKALTMQVDQIFQAFYGTIGNRVAQCTRIYNDLNQKVETDEENLSQHIKSLHELEENISSLVEALDNFDSSDHIREAGLSQKRLRDLKMNVQHRRQHAEDKQLVILLEKQFIGLEQQTAKDSTERQEAMKHLERMAVEAAKLGGSLVVRNPEISHRANSIGRAVTEYHQIMSCGENIFLLGQALTSPSISFHETYGWIKSIQEKLHQPYEVRFSGTVEDLKKVLGDYLTIYNTKVSQIVNGLDHELAQITGGSGKVEQLCGIATRAAEMVEISANSALKAEVLRADNIKNRAIHQLQEQLLPMEAFMKELEDHPTTTLPDNAMRHQQSRLLTFKEQLQAFQNNVNKDLSENLQGSLKDHIVKVQKDLEWHETIMDQQAKLIQLEREVATGHYGVYASDRGDAFEKARDVLRIIDLIKTTKPNLNIELMQKRLQALSNYLTPDLDILSRIGEILEPPTWPISIHDEMEKAGRAESKLAALVAKKNKIMSADDQSQFDAEARKLEDKIKITRGGIALAKEIMTFLDVDYDDFDACGDLYNRLLSGVNSSGYFDNSRDAVVESISKKYNNIVLSETQAKQKIKEIDQWLTGLGLPKSSSEVEAIDRQANWFIDDLRKVEKYQKNDVQRQIQALENVIKDNAPFMALKREFEYFSNQSTLSGMRVQDARETINMFILKLKGSHPFIKNIKIEANKLLHQLEEQEKRDADAIMEVSAAPLIKMAIRGRRAKDGPSGEGGSERRRSKAPRRRKNKR